MSLESERVPSGQGGPWVEFRILGHLEVIVRGGLLGVGPLKQRTLLAYLLLHPNQVVPAGRLVEALWGEDPPRTARQSLQNGIGGLRKLISATRTLGAASIATRAPGYMLEVDPQAIDVHRFLRLRAEGRTALAGRRYEDASRSFRRALSCWRGSVLSDLVEAGVTWPAIDHLEEMRLAALEDRIDADLRLGRYSDVAGEVAQLLAATPLRERLWERLIIALYRADRQADALAAYRNCRRVLVDELGIEPNRRLRELERAILAQDTQYVMCLPESPKPAAFMDPEFFLGGTLSLPARSA
ncbi:AfsR/SARP family transcriptional regulator [Actinoallomurus spadix]|uniref:OmpR/PhoB-type domain-containing protein n=1 Tax=Actinoallomurus spadix TaxID=79912 RepID=A0ABP3H922_9ACTN|nr:AfsR/SARP family transcriptional regulator [Actinoallomurus spadix]MCO5991545.1 AfsR/SARP family transcriptional regulator [Actinoallomurus spadix]